MLKDPTFCCAGMARVVPSDVEPTPEKQAQDAGRKGMLAKDRECRRAKNSEYVIREKQREDENGLTYLSHRVLAVRPMMYGFGDSKDPDPETVELMEEIVMDYIIDTVRWRMIERKTAGEGGF